MGITVKTLKRKSISLKGPGEAASPDATAPIEGAPVEGQPGTPEGAQPDAAAQPDASHAVHGAGAHPVQYGKRPHYITPLIFAIIELILFGTLVGIQYVEYSFYDQPKCAFPNVASSSSTPIPSSVQTAAPERSAPASTTPAAPASTTPATPASTAPATPAAP